MKARIESDGSPFGIKVFADDGTDLTTALPIKSVSYHIDAGNMPELTLELGIAASFVGAAHVGFEIWDPARKRMRGIKRIEFADGSEWIAPP